METKMFFSGVKPSKFTLGQRRANYYDVSDVIMSAQYKVQDEEIETLEDLDLIYRALVAVLYNFAPLSGHPGGAISSGRIAQGLLFSCMDYDLFDPLRQDNDIIAYTAGHKAMGLYALWALRNELVRAADADGMPDERFQLRLEDLLGFRRNPRTSTPLFGKFNSKALDGHPTPRIPFVKTATGASGAGVGAGVGLALGAMDVYGDKAPRVHMIEGEGGMTAGRVAEAMAAGAAAQLSNAVLHIDWNQASIDSSGVCAENSKPGDYVQWAPSELAYLNDWNVVYVSNGHDFFQILTAQKFAVNQSDNKQPTAVVYRTVKGWKYGIEGRAAHGAGHKFSSDGYYATLSEFEAKFGVTMPRYCASLPTPEAVEKCFYDTLMVIRKAIGAKPALSAFALEKMAASKERLAAQARVPRPDAPDPEKAYTVRPSPTPPALRLKAGASVTPSETLAHCLGHLNDLTGGSLLISAADLYNSTSVALAGKHFGKGFYNSVSNPGSRMISAGGICEDAMGAIASGVSSFGSHIGVASSYAAFIAPLEHIAARLHAIGQQNRKELDKKPYSAFIMINAHAGIKTGEDGPTHADPQALQLLEENFPKGSMITLTPWEPREIWPLLAAALNKRPAVIAPFVTRPPETIMDRAAIGIPPAEEAAKGAYYFMRSDPERPHQGTVVLQGNGVASVFAREVMPRVKEARLNINVLYVASKELFELLDDSEKEAVFPEKLAAEAVGITDFTLPTMRYWVRSAAGISRTLHSFRNGRYTGSGSAGDVFKEAGLDAPAQFDAIKDYAESRLKK